MDYCRRKWIRRGMKKNHKSGFCLVKPKQKKQKKNAFFARSPPPCLRTSLSVHLLDHANAFRDKIRTQDGTRRALSDGYRAASRCNHVADVQLGSRPRIQTIDARFPTTPTQDTVRTVRSSPQEPVVGLGRVAAAHGPARRPKFGGKRRRGITQVVPWPRRWRTRTGRSRPPVTAHLPGTPHGASAVRVLAGFLYTADLRARRYHFLGFFCFFLKKKNQTNKPRLDRVPPSHSPRK